MMALMFGCSAPENQSNPEPPRENVFKKQTEAIDKAKAAEKEMEKNAAKQKQALEDQDR
jgi:hypothetical protein